MRPGTTTDEATRMREPVLEARELRQANEIVHTKRERICIPRAA